MSAVVWEYVSAAFIQDPATKPPRRYRPKAAKDSLEITARNAVQDLGLPDSKIWIATRQARKGNVRPVSRGFRDRQPLTDNREAGKRSKVRLTADIDRTAMEMSPVTPRHVQDKAANGRVEVEEIFLRKST